jgi:hypothetical protein
LPKIKEATTYIERGMQHDSYMHSVSVNILVLWHLGLTARTARGKSGCLALASDSIYIGTDSKQHVSK